MHHLLLIYLYIEVYFLKVDIFSILILPVNVVN
jgi:hypothetical protein